MATIESALSPIAAGTLAQILCQGESPFKQLLNKRFEQTDLRFDGNCCQFARNAYREAASMDYPTDIEFELVYLPRLETERSLWRASSLRLGSLYCNWWLPANPRPPLLGSLIFD